MQTLKAFWTLKLIALPLLLAGCLNHSKYPQCPFNKPYISTDEAIRIAVQAEEIADSSKYEISVDRHEFGYLVFFKALTEEQSPSFGAVRVDFCGKILSISGPL